MPHRESRHSTSLQTRLGVVALLFLALVLIASGLSAYMIRSWNENLERSATASVVAERVDELRVAYANQEAGILDFRASSDPEALELYRNGRVQAEQELSRLADATLTDPAMAAQLADVVDVAERWETEVAAPIVDDSPDAPVEDVVRNEFELLRSELDMLNELAADDLSQLTATTRRVRTSAFAVLFASALAAIVGTAVVTVLFRRWITRPLARIRTSVDQLGHDETVALPDTPVPELQEITDAIRGLQSSLVRARDRAITAYDGLSQSALLALQVRAELADELGRMPPGWSAASRLIPAEGLVAGDCYDVGLLDADHLYVVMIDVTGHGAQAALDALMAKGQVRAGLRTRLQPGAVIDWLARELDTGRNLLSAVAIVVELSTGRITYANAGHPPVLLTDGDETVELPLTGPLVGAFDTNWGTEEAELAAGWSLVVHTDGVTDVMNADRERFGEARLRACLNDPDPRTAIAEMQLAIDAFRGGSPRADDLTVVVLRRHPVRVGDDVAAVESDAPVDV